ncbi:hypothetical protein JTB14_000372 [Gonioctena quinquepunctata]|nr:hypothetical protein JTB14_000372 [Gonioctena quinquepunctata]
MLRCNVFTKPFHSQTRTFFYWVNLQFNALDEERKRTLGADRTCAEWILRNGGTVKWANSAVTTTDYNELPKEGVVHHLQEVDASNTNIMHNGFEHFKGCEHIRKLVLHKCYYLEDKALAELHYIKNSLLYLQVSSCPNITDGGLLNLNALKNLKDLVIFDLDSVKHMETTVQELKSNLTCNIKTK